MNRRNRLGHHPRRLGRGQRQDRWPVLTENIETWQGIDQNGRQQQRRPRDRRWPRQAHPGAPSAAMAHAAKSLVQVAQHHQIVLGGLGQEREHGSAVELEQAAHARGQGAGKDRAG